MTVRIQTDDFDVGREQRAMTSNNTDIGAIVTFTGVVRGTTQDKNLTTMALEHYPGMTEREFERIEAEARSRWPLQDCLIVHRVGQLKPGDNIVLVITASSHRRAAFEAAQFLMDYLKTDAPFWKKEQTEDGNTQWVENRKSDDRARERWASGSKSSKSDAAE